MTDREIIDTLATKCMEWEHDGVFWRLPDKSWKYLRWTGEQVTDEDWNPLTNFNHAVEVVERLQDGGAMTTVQFMWDQQGENRVFVAVLLEGDDTAHEADDASAGRAICIAVLKALGVEAPDA